MPSLPLDLSFFWKSVSEPLSQFEEEFGLFKKPKEPTKPNQCFQVSIYVVFLLLCGTAAIVVFREYLGSFLSWLADLDGVEGPILIGILYIAVSFPFSWGYIVLNVGAGYIYGFKRGLLINVVGASIGAFVSFVVCRKVFTSYVATLLDQYRNFKQIIRILDGRQGVNIIAMTRLTPLPFGLQNAFFSASAISKRKYMMATIIGSLPTQLVNTYMGTTLRCMEDVVAGNASNTLVLIAQIGVTVVVSLLINHRMKKELKKACENETDLTLLAVVGTDVPDHPLRHVPSMQDVSKASDVILIEEDTLGGELSSILSQPIMESNEDGCEGFTSPLLPPPPPSPSKRTNLLPPVAHVASSHRRALSLGSYQAPHAHPAPAHHI